MLRDGGGGMKARCSVLPGNACAINRLDVVAALASHRVDAARATRYFVLAERLDVHSWVHFSGSLHGLLYRNHSVIRGDTRASALFSIHQY